MLSHQSPSRNLFEIQDIMGSVLGYLGPEDIAHFATASKFHYQTVQAAWPQLGEKTHSLILAKRNFVGLTPDQITYYYPIAAEKLSSLKDEESTARILFRLPTADALSLINISALFRNETATSAFSMNMLKKHRVEALGYFFCLALIKACQIAQGSSEVVNPFSQNEAYQRAAMFVCCTLASLWLRPRLTRLCIKAIAKEFEKQNAISLADSLSRHEMSFTQEISTVFELVGAVIFGNALPISAELIAAAICLFISGLDLIRGINNLVEHCIAPTDLCQRPAASRAEAPSPFRLSFQQDQTGAAMPNSSPSPLH
jgi:hypothetical protein